MKHTDDDEAADSEPKVDAVMYHKGLDLAMSLVEVSGPNYKVNKKHCIGDRDKLARNLKSILKAIEKFTKTFDIITLKKIKVYGMQAYCSSIACQESSLHTTSFFVKSQLTSLSPLVSLTSRLLSLLPSFSLASFLQRHDLQNW